MSTETQTAILGKFVWHDHMSGDVEKAKSFYAELLRWDVEEVDVGEEKYPMIKNDGQMHGGFGAAQGGAPSHWLGHVAVEDADETAEKVKAGGGTIYFGPSDIPDIGRFFVFADPQGAVLSAFASSSPPRDPRPRARSPGTSLRRATSTARRSSTAMCSAGPPRTWTWAAG